MSRHSLRTPATSDDLSNFAALIRTQLQVEPALTSKRNNTEAPRALSNTGLSDVPAQQAKN
jgi:hypothetical protein